MTAAELIAELQKLPQDAQVILQKDAEGNGYSPLEGVDGEAVYVPDSSWSGEVYSLEHTASDNCMEDDEWEKLKAGPRCVVLFPVN